MWMDNSFLSFFFKCAYIVLIGLYLAPSKKLCVVPESVEDIRISLLETKQLHVEIRKNTDG